MLPNEIFLSHSSHDHPFVDSVAALLRAHGLPVWYSKTNIIGARQWHDEIGTALQRCDWFVVILSPNATESMWVKRELMFVLQQERFEDKIVPVLYQPCDLNRLSWTLPIFQIVDLTRSLEDGYAELLRVWGIGYRK